MTHEQSQAKYKGRVVTVEYVEGDMAIVRVKHAGFWHDYNLTVNVSDLVFFEEHDHQIDSFNKCCQICGKNFS